MKQPAYAPDHLVTLPNGLRVVVVELPHLRAAHAAVFVRAGPRYEDDRTHGLSHVCEHMLFRGCGTFHSSQDLARAAERFQGTVDGLTYRDHAQYSTPLDPAGLGPALRLLATMMSRPRFQGLAVERRILLEEINECFDEHGREIEIDNIASRLQFPEHPAGRSIDGTAATVRSFRLRDLEEHHRRFYTAGNMVLSVAGPVRAAEVERMARRAWAGLPRGAPMQDGLGAPELPRGPRVGLVMHPGSQTELRLSFRAFSNRDPRGPALQLARRVLDDGFTSRFQADLVDRRGLAYEVWADTDLLEDTGTAEFGALVTHGKEAATVRALLGEATRLAREGPRRAELDRARRRFRWALEQMHDHAASVAEWYGRALLLGWERRPEVVWEQSAAVTPTAVRQAAAAVFRPEHTTLAVVGRPPRAQVQSLRAALRRFRAA